MVLTDDFVYIHLPKTAGTFMTATLKRIYGEEKVRDFDKHSGCSKIPTEYASLPIVSTLRNPYERYVSQYRFKWWKQHPDCFCGVDKMREMFPHYPDLSFADYLELAHEAFLGCCGQQPTGFENNKFSPERKLGWHTEQFVRFYFKNPRQVFAQIDEDYIEQERYHDDMFDVLFLRVERLNQEFHEFLLKTGHQPQDVEFVQSAGKVLPAEGGRKPGDHWTDYYTPELLKLVRTRERLLFKIFPAFDLETADITRNVKEAIAG